MDLSSPPLDLPPLADSLGDPPSPRVPLELLAHIVGDAIVDLIQGQKWKQAAQLCLVSTSLLPFARGALYHTIRLRHAPGAAGAAFVRAPARGSEPEVRFMSLDAKLLKALGACPLSARAVRGLDLLSPGVHFRRPIFQVEMDYVLATCPNVTAIRERQSNPFRLQYVDNALQNTGGANRLVSLRLDGTPCALGHARGLWHLTADYDVPLECAIPPTFALVSLDISRCSIASTEPAVQHYFSHSADSLSYLSIAHNAATPLLDLSRCTALASIRLMSRRDTTLTNVADAEMKLKTLATCSALRRLSFGADTESHASSLARTYESSSILCRLPHTIIHLDIRTLPFSLTHLLDLLQSAVAPSLHRLDVHRLSSDEQQQQLAEACWERGVELYTS